MSHICIRESGLCSLTMAFLPLVSAELGCSQQRAKWCLTMASLPLVTIRFQGRDNRLRAGSDVGFDSTARARSRSVLFPVVQDKSHCNVRIEASPRRAVGYGTVCGKVWWKMTISWCRCVTTVSGCTGLRDNALALPTPTHCTVARAHRHDAQCVFVMVAWSVARCSPGQRAGSVAVFVAIARVHHHRSRSAFRDM